MIEFDYRQERLRTGEIIFRPAAKVYLLRSESEQIAEYFYVDSGADYTLIPYRMGRFLGLEKIASEVKEIGGIGGVIAARFAVVSMKIEEYQFEKTPPGIFLKSFLRAYAQCMGLDGDIVASRYLKRIHD